LIAAVCCVERPSKLFPVVAQQTKSAPASRGSKPQLGAKKLRTERPPKLKQAENPLLGRAPADLAILMTMFFPSVHYKNMLCSLAVTQPKIQRHIWATLATISQHATKAQIKLVMARANAVFGPKSATGFAPIILIKNLDLKDYDAKRVWARNEAGRLLAKGDRLKEALDHPTEKFTCSRTEWLQAKYAVLITTHNQPLRNLNSKASKTSRHLETRRDPMSCHFEDQEKFQWSKKPHRSRLYYEKEAPKTGTTFVMRTFGWGLERVTKNAEVAGERTAFLNGDNGTARGKDFVKKDMPKHTKGSKKHGKHPAPATADEAALAAMPPPTPIPVVLAPAPAPVVVAVVDPDTWKKHVVGNIGIDEYVKKDEVYRVCYLQTDEELHVLPHHMYPFAVKSGTYSLWLRALYVFLYSGLIWFIRLLIDEWTFLDNFKNHQIDAVTYGIIAFGAYTINLRYRKRGIITIYDSKVVPMSHEAEEYAGAVRVTMKIGTETGLKIRRDLRDVRPPQDRAVNLISQPYMVYATIIEEHFNGENFVEVSAIHHQVDFRTIYDSVQRACTSDPQKFAHDVSSVFFKMSRFTNTTSRERMDSLPNHVAFILGAHSIAKGCTALNRAPKGSSLRTFGVMLQA